MKKITIRKLGARLLGDAEAVILKSMRDQNKLWNKFVEIERANRDEYRNIVTDSDAELSEVSQAYKEMEKSLEDVQVKRNKVRAAQKTKKIEGAENYADEIKSISARLKEMRARMKECRARAKVIAQPRLDDLEARRRLAVKQAFSEADMWWAHSELVVNAFDVARAKALKTNAELRFHRFDGAGRVGVRFSKGLRLDAPISTSFLTVRKPTSQELGHLKEERARKRLLAVDMRVGKGGGDGAIPMATFLVTEHEGQELLGNTPLKTVIAKREMHAGRAKWFMVFMFVDPDAAQEDKPLQAKAVGVDFGWRAVKKPDEWGDGTGLRVGTVVGSDGSCEHITLSPDLIARFARADSLKAQLDVMANQFWGEFGPFFTDALLEKMSEDEWLRIIVSKARRARQPYPSLMLSIAEAHSKNPVLGVGEKEKMDVWARRAKRLTIAAFGTRRKATEHRKHIYRNVAARVAQDCGLIAIKNTDLKSLAKLVDDQGKENDLSVIARANRFIASPSELRLAIKQAGQREMCDVREIEPQYTTATCSSCGHVHGTKITDLMFVCDSCGKLHDQDENSARNCLKEALVSMG